MELDLKIFQRAFFHLWHLIFHGALIWFVYLFTIVAGWECICVRYYAWQRYNVVEQWQKALYKWIMRFVHFIHSVIMAFSIFIFQKIHSSFFSGLWLSYNGNDGSYNFCLLLSFFIYALSFLAYKLGFGAVILRHDLSVSIYSIYMWVCVNIYIFAHCFDLMIILMTLDKCVRSYVYAST